MGLELARAFVRIRGDSSRLKGDLNKVRRETTKSLSGVADAAVGAVSAAISAVLFKIGSSIIKLAADFEETTIAFTTMLGGAGIAKKKLDELAKFAARTPFTIPGVENAARGLIAVGFSADELLPTLKALGDVSAGLGRGEEGLRRLVLNLGQVKAQAKLTGRELRDFTILGVPLLDELAKILGVAKDQIFSLTQAGDISSEVVVRAFKNMSSEGGRFADLMFRINKITKGQFSNLKDEIIILARAFGENLLPTITKIIKMFIGFVDVINQIVTRMGPVTKGVIALGFAMATLAFAARAAAVALLLLKLRLNSLLIATVIGAAIVLLTFALEKFISKLIGVEDEVEEFNNMMGDFAKINEEAAQAMGIGIGVSKKFAKSIGFQLVAAVEQGIKGLDRLVARLKQLGNVAIGLPELAEKLKARELGKFEKQLAGINAEFHKLIVQKDPVVLLKNALDSVNDVIQKLGDNLSDFAKKNLQELGKELKNQINKITGVVQALREARNELDVLTGKKTEIDLIGEALLAKGAFPKKVKELQELLKRIDKVKEEKKTKKEAEKERKQKAEEQEKSQE